MSYSAEEMAIFREYYERSKEISKVERKKSVEKTSPYSRKINVFIRTTKELQVYIALKAITVMIFVNHANLISEENKIQGKVLTTTPFAFFVQLIVVATHFQEDSSITTLLHQA